jgi:hypothetical protein
MAWKELAPSGVYHVGLRLGGKKFCRSLNSDDEGVRREGAIRRVRIPPELLRSARSVVSRIA